MTLSILPGLVTGLLLLLFLFGIAWAFSPHRKTAFDAAARLPLEEEGSDGMVASDGSLRS